jgi:hypothetical protein
VHRLGVDRTTPKAAGGGGEEKGEQKEQKEQKDSEEENIRTSLNIDTVEEQPKNRPSAHPLYQQTMWSCQFHLTEKTMVVVVAIVALILLVLGAAIYSESRSVVERGARYDGGLSIDSANDGTWATDRRIATKSVGISDVGNPFRMGWTPRRFPDQCVGQTQEGLNRTAPTKSCVVKIHVDVDMKAPIKVYYHLTRFHQNYRQYVKSMDFTQLDGDSWTPKDPQQQCAATVIDLNASLATAVQYGHSSLPAMPCGLQTASLFNDTFTFLNGTTPPSASSSSSSPSSSSASSASSSSSSLSDVTINETNIAWEVDRQFKFVNPEGYPEGCGTKGYCLYQMHPDIVTREEGVTNEHYMVWMRLNALPTFRKLYGRIDRDIPAGTDVFLRVESRFPVWSFNGTKTIILASESWTGANMMGFGVIYMSCGLVALFVAIAVAVKMIVRPRAADAAQKKLLQTKGTKHELLLTERQGSRQESSLSVNAAAGVDPVGAAKGAAKGGGAGGRIKEEDMVVQVATLG